MKKVIIMTLAAAVMTTITSCNINIQNRDIELMTRNVETTGFHRINILGSCDVKFTQGDSISIRVEATEKRLDDIVVESDGETLTIKNKDDDKAINTANNKNNQKVVSIFDYSGAATVYITAPSLDAVAIYGAGDFECKDYLKTSQLSLSIMGSGDIDVDNLDAGLLDISIKGAGDVNLKMRNVNETRADISGSGDVEMYCTNCNLATVNISGVGDVLIKGDMKDVKKTISGVGEVKIK